MVKSMTGFGRYETEENNKHITVEVKAVNHRYLDLNIKCPKKFYGFEGRIRNIFKEYKNNKEKNIGFAGRLRYFFKNLIFFVTF